MKLYAFSFNGTTVYATGNLSNEQTQEVTVYLNNITISEKHVPIKDLFKVILQNIKKDISIELEAIPIEHVFRCDKW